MYLLDTNIVSADAPARRHIGLDTLAAWMRKHSEFLFISTITVAEIEAGIARAVRIGATAKAERLRHWLAAVEHLYGARILPFDLDAAREAGAILDRARAHDPGFEDIVIAATAAAAAAAHDFVVLTANERHFAPLGVPFVNPLKQLPS